jgi:hypothetical protein
MPRSWAETQAAFAAAVMDPRLPTPADVIECGPDATECGPRRGFAVYRNNSLVTLIDALQERFPVTCRLVGEEFFRAMARSYVSGNRPRSPLLMNYGDDFARFVEGFAPANGVPYLSDIARLEVAWSQSYHAAEASSLQVRALADERPDALLEMRLTLHPSTRVLRSAYPIADIWSAHQAVGAVMRPTRWEPQDVLVVRPAADVEVNAVSFGLYDFVAALLDRHCVQHAAEGALRAHPDFDLGQSLVDLLRFGAIVAFGSVATQKEQT